MPAETRHLGLDVSTFSQFRALSSALITTFGTLLQMTMQHFLYIMLCNGNYENWHLLQQFTSHPDKSSWNAQMAVFIEHYGLVLGIDDSKSKH